MMERFANPTPRWIAGLFAAAAVLLLLAGWMINSGNENISAYAFPPVLIGLTVLFIAMAQLALWALNRAGAKPPAN